MPEISMMGSNVWRQQVNTHKILHHDHTGFSEASMSVVVAQVPLYHREDVHLEEFRRLNSTKQFCRDIHQRPATSEEDLKFAVRPSQLDSVDTPLGKTLNGGAR